MARYRKVYPRLWSQLRSMSDAERVTTLYCLTGPQTNGIGLFEFSVARAAEDLGTLPQTFAKRFANVCEGFGWVYDSAARVLWIPSWWSWNPPENQNVLKGLLDNIEELPQTILLQQFANHTETLPERLHQTFAERIAQRIPKPSPKQEQEQEQEQDKKEERTSAVADGPPSPPVDTGDKPEKKNGVPADLKDLTLYRADTTLCKRWPELKPAWEEACPGIDVLAEVRLAHAWEIANPKKRKRDRPRFLGAWMNRAQDKKGGRGAGKPEDSWLSEAR